jgi:outer membrane cobalamin receptor
LILGLVPHATAAVQGGSIAGTVTDAAGAALAGATIRLVSRTRSERATVSGHDGSFEVDSLPPGVYLVEVSAPGFRVESLEAVEVPPGEARRLNVSLKVAEVSEEITVTAAGTPQARDEVTRSVEVVTREEVEARGEVALPEALTAVAGLRVQRQGGPGSLTTLRFRGLRSQDTSILVDDLRVRDASDLYGSLGTFFEDLLLTDIERVEVVRGAGSTLYGTNAVGGVVNLIPARGAGTPWVEALLEGGSLGTFHGRARSAGGAGRFDYSVGVEQYNVTQGVDGDDPYRNTALAGRAGVRLGHGIRVTGNLLFTDSTVNLNGNPFFVGPDPANPFGFLFDTSLPPVRFADAPNDPDDERDGRLFNGSLAFEHAVNAAWSYTARYSATRTRRELTSGPGIDPDYYDLVAPLTFDADGDGLPDVSGSGNSLFRGTVHTIDLRNRVALGRSNLVTAGFEIERESFFQYFFGPFGSSRQPFNLFGFDYDFDGVNDASLDNQWTGAVFAFDQISLLDGRLQVGLGARYQALRLGETEVFMGVSNEAAPDDSRPQPAPESLSGLETQDAVTGDGSIAYTFRASGTRVWAHVGNSFRAPSLYERFSNVTAPSALVRAGDPTIKPELSITADGGVEQTAFGGRMRAGMTYFYTSLQRQINFASFFDPATGGSTDPLGLGRFFGYVNTTGGLARGVEVTARATPLRTLDLLAAYTFVNSDTVLPSALTTADGRLLPANSQARAFGIPDHTFSLQAIQRIGRLSLALDLLSQSSHDAQLFEPVFFGSRVFTFDGYARADLSASYTIPVSDRAAVTLFGRVENLTDTDILENGVRLPGASGYGGVKVRF